MKATRTVVRCVCAAMLQLVFSGAVSAQPIHISYPGLTGESSPLWIASEAGLLKEYGIDARLVYMEGGRLSIQSLLSNTTQFMAGDAVSALSAIAGGADIVLLASAKNVLPYVFAVSKDVRRPEDLKGKVIATSQVGGRAGEIARMAVRNMGLDPDKDVTYLAVGGTMSRLAALTAGRVNAAPISHIVVPLAEERGLKIMQLEPIPLIVDALWTSRKFAEDNPQMVQNVLRAYTRAIAILVKDREKSIEIMRKYMRVSDPRVVQSAYERYKEELDRVPLPSEMAIKNTLEISYRVAPKLNGMDIKRHLYFTPLQRLAAEGFIERLYK
jgi:ABC-type nitrate/sulfonate/bicarbonate transport system substrate-binding protein